MRCDSPVSFPPTDVRKVRAPIPGLFPFERDEEFASSLETDQHHAKFEYKVLADWFIALLTYNQLINFFLSLSLPPSVSTYTCTRTHTTCGK